MEELKKKILLVDDEEEILGFLSATLKRNNYEVVATSKAVEALELAKEVKPDVIILDVVMPGVDGGELAVSLGNDSKTKDIPIIFATGLVDKKEELSQIKAGKQYELLVKPVDPKELLATLTRVLLTTEEPQS